MRKRGLIAILHKAAGEPASGPFLGLGALLGCMAALSILAFALSRASGSTFPADESAVVISEARCVDSAGIAIAEVPDNQAKLACLQTPEVQRQCNPDGRQARLEAFRRWEGLLMNFQTQCEQEGGRFGFAEAGFKEPADETFCSIAEPEVQYGNLENPLCNFVSRCPAVAVICHFEEDITPPIAQRMVSLPGVPIPVALR